MPLVNVMVNSRAYTIACDAGEEPHLKELAQHVDEKVKELIGTVGQVGDQKLLLMAAVLITDEFFEARGRLDADAKKTGELSSAHAEASGRAEQSEQLAASALEDAARRLEGIVEKLKAA
jgi:cell division protein ZapA